MSDLIKIAERQQPANRRSKLEPYLDELRRLQNAGYSLEQLKNFLAEINVNVSRQTIYDFLKRRESVIKNTSTHSDKKTEITKKEAGDEVKETPLANAEISEKITKTLDREVKNTDVKKPVIAKTPTQEELKNIARSTNVDDFFGKN